MRNSLKFFLLLALYPAQLAVAEVGCMTNRAPNKGGIDYHEWHPVECDCPCTKRHKIFAKMGRCYECDHCRDPKLLIIIEAKDMPKTPIKVPKAPYGLPIGTLSYNY
ncbi:MAG: hypothetical protein NTX86_00465 [Candidatus Dependentiae bacterium]|nr:hypothetical protein [Candidatus Dependentiae bacterium]